MPTVVTKNGLAEAWYMTESNLGFPEEPYLTFPVVAKSDNCHYRCVTPTALFSLNSLFLLYVQAKTGMGGGCPYQRWRVCDPLCSNLSFSQLSCFRKYAVLHHLFKSSTIFTVSLFHSAAALNQTPKCNPRIWVGHENGYPKNVNSHILLFWYL